MYSHEARVICANLKDDIDVVMWLTDHGNRNQGEVMVISVTNESYTCAVFPSVFDQMMKHFDPEWVSKAEVDAARGVALQELIKNVQKAKETNDQLIADIKSGNIFNGR